MERFVRLHTADGFEIATAIMPTAGDDIVLWMHGIQVDKDEYKGFFRDGARSVADAGFTSVRFDFRGHGQSSGSSVDFSVVGQSIDVAAVVRNVREKLWRTTSRLHLIASSFGAPAAIFAAAKYSSIVQTVSLISPVRSYRRTFLRPETPWAADFFTEANVDAIEGGGTICMDEDFHLSTRLIEEMRIIRPDLALAELTQPTLVMHGDRDSMVPYEATADACRGLPHVRMVTMRGVDHGYMVEGDEEGTDPLSIKNKDYIYQQLLRHMQA